MSDALLLYPRDYTTEEVVPLRGFEPLTPIITNAERSKGLHKGQIRVPCGRPFLRQIDGTHTR